MIRIVPQAQVKRYNCKSRMRNKSSGWALILKSLMSMNLSSPHLKFSISINVLPPAPIGSQFYIGNWAQYPANSCSFSFTTAWNSSHPGSWEKRFLIGTFGCWNIQNTLLVTSQHEIWVSVLELRIRLVLMYSDQKPLVNTSSSGNSYWLLVYGSGKPCPLFLQLAQSINTLYK